MICLIQARMSSKRFKGKILNKIKHYEIFFILYKRLKKSKLISKIVFVTSNHRSDDIFCNILKKKKINFFRGDLNNVALRFLNCVEKYKKKDFIRICCDSPLINWKLADKLIDLSKKKEFDIITNSLDSKYAKGMGIEIIKTSSLKKNILFFSKIEKEHVTKYFYKNKFKFKIVKYNKSKKTKFSNYCVDYPSDIRKLNKIIGGKNPINSLNF
tara:strand:+ start:1926 stop:2564 length:639 start_codon:yes stop_codon:yes gene_type:complete